MRPTVIVTHRIPQQGMETLLAQYTVHYPQAYAYTEQELLDLAPQADAVLAGGRVSRAFVEAAGKLRVVSNYGVGYDAVDVAALTERRIPLTNLPDECAAPTAEVAMALLLAVSRRVAEQDRVLRAAAPERAFGMGKNMGHCLYGRTLGIVGMGRIGQLVAGMARAFGMRVVYHNRAPLPPELAGDAAYLPLEALMEESDAVTLHCPLTEGTRGLIGAAQLARMRPDAVIINTARGAVMDYDALAVRLADGAIGGAGLDVFPDEPHVPAALLKLDSVVLTPHIGCNAYEARAAMCAQAVRHIEQALAGQRPEHVVNPEIYA